MHNYLPRLCRIVLYYTRRSPLLVGSVVVCLLAGFTRIARAFNGTDPQITPWQHYKWQIIGAVSLMIIETLLIAFLLISRARQRRAEAERERFARLAESEHRRLEEVVSNVPGIVWESRVETNGITRREHFVSQHVEKMLGYTVEEWM